MIFLFSRRKAKRQRVFSQHTNKRKTNTQTFTTQHAKLSKSKISLNQNCKFGCSHKYLAKIPNNCELKSKLKHSIKNRSKTALIDYRDRERRIREHTRI